MTCRDKRSESVASRTTSVQGSISGSGGSEGHVEGLWRQLLMNGRRYPRAQKPLEWLRQRGRKGQELLDSAPKRLSCPDLIPGVGIRFSRFLACTIALPLSPVLPLSPIGVTFRCQTLGPKTQVLTDLDLVEIRVWTGLCEQKDDAFPATFLTPTMQRDVGQERDKDTSTHFVCAWRIGRMRSQAGGDGSFTFEIACWQYEKLEEMFQASKFPESRVCSSGTGDRDSGASQSILATSAGEYLADTGQGDTDHHIHI